MLELSRRERERLNRRAEILRAAWEVFTSKDYDAATVDEVAAVAELSKGTLYLYFQSKVDLFLSTFEMGMEMINSIIREVISANSDPVIGLKEIIIRLLDFSEKNAGFFKMMSSEHSHFEMSTDKDEKCEFAERIMSAVSVNMVMIADYIQLGIEMGVFRQVEPMDFAFILLSIFRGLTFRRIVDPTSGTLPEKAETITTILFDGLTTGSEP